MKWKKLLDGRISLIQSVFHVLSGYSTALWSPGQWAHFVGRKWHTQNESWGAVTGKTLLSGFWQSWAYVAMGGLSLWFLDQPKEAVSLWLFFKYTCLLVALLGVGFVFLFAERPINIPFNYFRNKLWKFFVESIDTIAKTRRQLHLQLLILSVFKSAVVFMQLGILLSDDPEQWLGIPLVFMALTLLPLPFILGMIARGELILQIWHWLQWPAAEAYASIYLLWMINVLLPAILGTIAFLSRPKNKNDE